LIGAVAELLGATGVILSLLYLGRQIRSASLADQRARYEQALAEATAWAESLATEGELAEIVLRGLNAGPSALTPVERFRFNASIIKMFRAYEKMTVYSTEGGVPAWGKKTFDEVFRDLMDFSGFRHYWSDRRHWFVPEMQSEIDSLIARPGRTVSAVYEETGGESMPPEGSR
jgi:hypothetical protein